MSNPYVKAVTAQHPPKTAKSAKVNKGKSSKGTPTAVSSNGSEQPKHHSKPGKKDNSALRQEVLALGGDEAELDMLEQVESESELEEDAVGADSSRSNGKSSEQIDPSLSKELKSFMKSLDFASLGKTHNLNLDEDEEIEDDVPSSEEEADSSQSDVSALEASSESETESEGEEEEKIVPKIAPVAEKKESKFEREEKRKQEREEVKAKLAEEKQNDVAAAAAVPKMPVSKSPWLIDPTPQWYAVPVPAATSAPGPSAALIEQLYARGQTLLAQENSLYASSLSPSTRKSAAPPPPNGLSKADQVFIQQILSSGTSSDKVSALLLLVASSPLHTMTYLEQLATLAKKKSRDESGRAIRGIVEWWRGDGGEGGGSPSRKLRIFADQPSLGVIAQVYQAINKGGNSTAPAAISKREMEQSLILFAFEDWLKNWFFQVLQSIEQMSVDPLPHPRTLAVLHLSNLLRDKPEQEGNILRLLVNKLGDSNRNIASKTSHHLLQILQFHPGMTSILVREVSALILRPSAASTAANTPGGSHVRFGSSSKEKSGVKSKPAKDSGQDHARYYGVITLNQVMLKKEQSEIAGKMISLYFEIFGDILGRVTESAEPIAEQDDEEKSTKKAEKRKRTSLGGKAGKGKAEEIGLEGEVNETDSKLVAAVLTGVNRAFPFANLDENAFKERMDTLFRITHTGTFNVSIQALMLIYSVSASKREISDRFYRALYASLYDARLATSSKQALYLNLVFKAMKFDRNSSRVLAFIKRLIQIMLGMETTFILGSIWIVSEMLATVPGLRDSITEPENAKESAAESNEISSGGYDGQKREPQFACAEKSCLWELIPLLNHFHPSVALHAQQLIQGTPISASLDLEKHSLNHFLDRFVYRQPKKLSTTKGSSMMQSGVVGQDRSNRIIITKGTTQQEEINTEDFKQKHSSQIPVDQLFFHTYFTGKSNLGTTKAKAVAKRKGTKKGGEEGESDDEESIGDLGADDAQDLDESALREAMDDDDEENSSDSAREEEIWQAMKKSAGKGDADLEDLMQDGQDSELGVDEDDDALEQFDYTDSEAETDSGEKPFKSAFDEENEQDEADLGLLEEEDDLIGSDEDMPESGDEVEGKKGAARSGRNEQRKNKKRKLKHMPLFATADDYAHLLGGSDDEEL